MTTPPRSASSIDPQTCVNVSATRDYPISPHQQPRHEQCGESSGKGFLDINSTPADIAVRAIAVSTHEDFGTFLAWLAWCQEIATAADQGDRAEVNQLTTRLDRR